MATSTTTKEMALDTTTKGGVLKLQLTGEKDKIVEFPRSFVNEQMSKALHDMLNSDTINNVSPDEAVELPEIIGGDFMDFYIKYCTWMANNPELVNQRYKESEDGQTRKFDMEAELTDWEKELLFEMNTRFKNGYQITEWQSNFFKQLGRRITTEVRYLEKPGDGKEDMISTQTDLGSDEECEYFNAHGWKILEKTPEKVKLQWKEYIDDPYQSVFTSIIYCIEFFDNEFMNYACKKFFAQEILPRWTPEELKALTKEEFEAMKFKERYSEYDSNRDKLDYDKIDELDRHALPKRTSKELAHLMGRNWIKNPHATEDPVEYLNDPFQIYTLVCPGPEKCYAKDCPNYQNATPDGKSATDDN